MKSRLKNKLKRIKQQEKQPQNISAMMKKLNLSAEDQRINKAIGEGRDAVEEIFIIIRDQVPHLFEGFKEAAFTDISSEEIEEFYDRIAARDAWKAGKGPKPPVYQVGKRKEYEMPDYYKEYVEQLTRMIEKRDEYNRAVPLATPDLREQLLAGLDELNSAIENIEEKLAEEYELYQEERDVEERELSKAALARWQQAAKEFLFIKKYQPDELQSRKEALMEDEDWVHIARWIDRLTNENYNPPPAAKIC